VSEKALFSDDEVRVKMLTIEEKDRSGTSRKNDYTVRPQKVALAILKMPPKRYMIRGTLPEEAWRNISEFMDGNDVVGVNGNEFASRSNPIMTIQERYCHNIPSPNVIAIGPIITKGRLWHQIAAEDAPRLGPGIVTWTRLAENQRFARAPSQQSFRRTARDHDVLACNEGGICRLVLESNLPKFIKEFGAINTLVSGRDHYRSRIIDDHDKVEKDPSFNRNREALSVFATNLIGDRLYIISLAGESRASHGVSVAKAPAIVEFVLHKEGDVAAAASVFGRGGDTQFAFRNPGSSAVPIQILPTTAKQLGFYRCLPNALVVARRR
jgi:hypothetical protein